MKVTLLVPISGLDGAAVEQRLVFLRSIAAPGTTVDYIQVRDGPPAIECEVDHVLASAEVCKVVRKAEDAGAEAVIIWCAGDPGLDAARTMVDIPVIGPGESMRMLAGMLGKRVAAVAAPLPVLELRKDLNMTKELVMDRIDALVGEGYDSFYLDCLGLFGLGRPIRETSGLPVVDPAEASLKVAEAAIQLGLRHSRVAYPKYPPVHRRP